MPRLTRFLLAALLLALSACQSAPTAAHANPLAHRHALVSSSSPTPKNDFYF